MWASVRGGPCSLLLLQFPLLLPAPFNFLLFAPFLLFPCSFFIFLCSLLLCNLSSCSMLLFQIFHCSMLLFTIFGAPCSRITLVCCLLLYLIYDLLLAPLCQIGLAPCSGITPNGGSDVKFLFHNKKCILTGRPIHDLTSWIRHCCLLSGLFFRLVIHARKSMPFNKAQ